MVLGWGSHLQWTADGFLPGNDPADGVSEKRSPYVIALPNFVSRFGHSVKRRELLDGFLRYRALLKQAGLDVGFQWVNGSLVEDVERVRGRPPADVDVVSFIQLPTGVTESELYQSHKNIIDGDLVVNQFSVDGYIVVMDMAHPDTIQYAIRNAVYWHSVWSHTRDSQWKGYVELDLGHGREPEAWRALQELSAAGGS